MIVANEATLLAMCRQDMFDHMLKHLAECGRCFDTDNNSKYRLPDKSAESACVTGSLLPDSLLFGIAAAGIEFEDREISEVIDLLPPRIQAKLAPHAEFLTRMQVLHDTGPWCRVAAILDEVPRRADEFGLRYTDQHREWLDRAIGRELSTAQQEA